MIDVDFLNKNICGHAPAVSQAAQEDETEEETGEGKAVQDESPEWTPGQAEITF